MTMWNKNIYSIFVIDDFSYFLLYNIHKVHESYLEVKFFKKILPYTTLTIIFLSVQIVETP